MQRRLRAWPVKAALGALLTAGLVLWIHTGTAGRTLAGIGRANPRLETAAVLAFLVSLLASALSWRIAFTALGAPSLRIVTCARYAAGCVTNTFTPARAGDVVRAALFARELPARRRMTEAAAAVAAIAVTRASVHSVVLVSGAVAGAFPWWPLLVLAAGALAASGALLAVRRSRFARLEHFGTAVAGLLSRPLIVAQLLACAGLAVAARILAAAAAASALGVPSPMLAALAVTAALDAASLVPALPGGVGIVSGAVSLALVGRGVSASAAIAVGLVFQSLETLTSLGFAAVCIPLAARPRLARHPAARGAGALGAACAAAFLVAVVVIPAF